MSDDQRCATCRFWDHGYGPGLADHLGHLDEEPGVCQRIVDDLESDDPEEGARPAYLYATIEPVDGVPIAQIIRGSGIADDGTAMAAMLWTYADFGCVLWEKRTI